MKPLTDEARIHPVGIELRTEKVNGHKFLHGRAVPYNTPADIGWYMEEHAPGSFEKSIEEAARGLPLLLNHDTDAFPIGVAEEWDDNAAGLDGIWRLDTAEIAQEAARLASEGMLAYMSIRFAPIRSDRKYAKDLNPDLGPKHKDHIRRIESRLIEVSLVSAPAFKEAAVEFVRTAERPRAMADPNAELKAWKAELAKLRG